MMQQAAVALGVPLRLLAEAEGMSAAQVIADTLVGDYLDPDRCGRVAEGCAVVTFDHEHVPTDLLETLEADGIATRPGPERARPRAGQGRDARRLAELDVAAARASRSTPPTRRRGRGRRLPRRPQDHARWVRRQGCLDHRLRDEARRPSLTAPAGVDVLAEERVDFRRELAALVARSPSGQVAAYPVVESRAARRHLRRGDRAAPDLAPDLAVRRNRSP